MRKALLDLIEIRPLDQITQRDITAAAGVSYPTFFKHYESKEDLFRDVARAEIVALLAAFRKGREAPNWRPGRGMCDHIVARRRLWQLLLSAGASEAMRSEFISRGREFPSRRPALGHGFPFDVVSGIVASGTFEIIAWWLKQGEDYPVTKVADMLETLVIEPGLGVPPGYFTGRTQV